MSTPSTSRLTAASSPILTPAHLTSLRSAGVFTCADLVAADLNSLANRCSLSFAELSLVRKGILEGVQDPLTGSSLLKLLFAATILKTGFSELDRLIGGGLYTGEILELCGASKTGKTRVCLSIAAETARAGKATLCATPKF